MAMKSAELTVAPDWQALANRLTQILGREIISGQKYQREDERKFWVSSGGITTAESIAVALPPYTEDDLEAIDFEWRGLPTTSPLWSEPQWVVGRDDSYNTYLLRVGVEFDPLLGHRVCVRWPTAWPANAARGRGDLRCSSARHDWHNVALPDGWNVRVWALNLNECVLGLRGLIDIHGEFVVPCEYEHISVAEGLLTKQSETTEEPLPVGRVNRWMWSEVCKHREPTKDSYGRDVCDVVEVWSGKRINPVGTKALRNTLSHGYFQITPDSTYSNLTAGSEVGLMLASLSQPAPMLWKRILGVVPFGALAAQCINTGLYGYVGATGQTVVEPQFISASSFTDDWAIVEMADGKKGAIAIDFEATLKTPLTATMSTLPWRWLLQPVWDDIADEYDGHFTVQNSEKKWGMVSPLDKPVTPFSFRENPDSYKSGEDKQAAYDIHTIHDICRHQFKRLQKQRFVELLVDLSNKPKDQRSLENMQGLLHSSWGRYDYGSLSHTKLTVRVRFDVLGSGLFKQNDFSYKSLPHEFKAGVLFEWDPSERNYAGSVDISTYAALKQAKFTNLYYAFVPWSALELVLASEFQDGFDIKAWVQRRKKLAQTYALYVALNAWGEWLESNRYILKTGVKPENNTQNATQNMMQADFWDAEDACSAVLWLAQVLQFEILQMITEGGNLGENDFWNTLDHGLKEVDLPSLFESKRYQVDTTVADKRFRQTPMWIATDDSPNAIAPDHPWVLEMQVLRKTAMDAYLIWRE
jgi:WG containing repeat